MTWHDALASDLVEDDDVVGVKVADKEIAIYRVDGRIYATSNICTHGDALLSEGWVDEGCIECPLHQGRFDITTGKGQGAPISVDLQTFAAKEDSGRIFVELP